MEPLNFDQKGNTAEEWRTTLTAYSLAFTFLNRVFYRPPDVELLSTLAAEKLFQAWPLSAENDATRQGLALLQAFMRRWQPEELPALQKDYAALFVGPGHLLAPPWESVYLSEDHLVFEQETIDVRAFYRRFGVRVPRQNVEPDDHFALELAFLVHLNDLTLEAIQAGEDAEMARLLGAQRSFLADHLLRWAPSFLQRVDEHATTSYYRGAARLAQGALEHLASLLAVPIQSVAVDNTGKGKRQTFARQHAGFSVREL